MARASAIKRMKEAGQVKRGTSVLVYGPPKSGKTALVAQLAQHKKLLWLDIESGSAVLFNEKVVNPDFLDNIELVEIPDFKKEPVAIEYVMKAFQGDKLEICDDHGRSNCIKCKGNKESTSVTLDLFNLDPNEWIVVLDSLTQLTRSAVAYITKKQLAGVDAKFEFDHYRLQNIYLDAVLDMCQAGKFNVVCITHETGIDQVDGTEKITPSASTKNYARTIAKNFDSVIYCHMNGTHHKFSSETSQSPKAITGTRSNVDIQADGLIALFDASKRTVVPKEQEAVSKKPAGRKLLRK